jgi:hypothetical protein
MVADGERVTCEGVIRAAPLLIVGALFSVDLFVMPLAGYDVVLGTKLCFQVVRLIAISRD